MKRKMCLALACVTFCFAGMSSHGWSDDRSAAELMPPTTVLYAELRQPEQLAELVPNHPLRRDVLSLENVQRIFETKQYLQFKAVVGIIEAELGRPWQKLLGTVLGGGVALGVDAETQGVAVLLKSKDASTPEQIVSALVKLARQEAQRKGNPDPIKSGEYRGITAYDLEQAKLAVFGPWLLLTNKLELGKLVLDHYLDKSDATLAAKEPFAVARAATSTGAAAWGFVDTAALRAAGVAKKVFKGQTNNPLGELLVGGVLSNLQKTPYVTARLAAGQEQLRLEFAAPHDPHWVDQSRDYFFGPDGAGAAPPLLSANNRIFSLSAHRDISGMWLRAGDLFNERINDQLAKADSNLSTLFSGRDFGQDILGTVKPDVQLIVVRQTFQEGTPQPAIKLPAFALVFELKDPETMRSELRRIFQSLIGFLNVLGAMQGQPQLNLDMDKDGDVQVVSGTYLPEKDAKDLNRLPINFNFSPSVAFVGSHFIVSSTQGLARELAANSAAAGRPRPSVNTTATADLLVLRDILADNRDHLVAQNMLEEGHTKEEAEQQIAAFLMLIGLLREASLDLTTADNTLRLGLEVTLQSK